MNLMLSLTVMISFVLLIVLVLNFEDKNKIIKYSFTAFLIVLFISLFFTNELIVDYLLSEIIRYWYFPRFSSIIATLIFTLLILLYFVYSEHLEDKYRIINYIFALYIFCAYVMFMYFKVNIDSYNALYSENSLLCIRYISRTFIIWIIVNIVIKYVKYFLRKG